jgi:hypothetical protein
MSRQEGTIQLSRPCSGWRAGLYERATLREELILIRKDLAEIWGAMGELEACKE